MNRFFGICFVLGFSLCSAHGVREGDPSKESPSYQTSDLLPVFDIIASYDRHNNAGFIVGSFRMKRKFDYEFLIDKPEFYIALKDVSEEPITVVSNATKWRKIDYATDQVWVEVASTDTKPVTEAIVGFRLPVSRETSRWLAQRRGASLAVMMHGQVEESDAGYESTVNSREEWSFSICPFAIRGRDALDTNGMIPITRYDRPPRYQIGSVDIPFWLNDFFKGTWMAFQLNCKPQFFVSPAASGWTPSDWLSKPWTSLGQIAVPTDRSRAVSASIAEGHDYLMIYSPDYADFKGRRYFQISGIVRDLRNGAGN